MIHTAIAEPNTVSLMVRGPAVKERMRMINMETNQVRWKVGRQQQTERETERVRMSEARYARLLAQLESCSVI